MPDYLATVGILSIGDMGLGVAKLLAAHGCAVVTNVSDRSQSTQNRAHSASIELLSSDVELVERSDYILSIVPPRDALQIARRISDALRSAQREQSTPLYFLDLNAISPLTARKVVETFHDQSTATARVIDGGILGGPPKSTTNDGDIKASWYKPVIVVSGPDTLNSAPVSGSHIESLLNVKHIHSDFGSASGLKMCFAALNKGYVAIAIQSFTTANQLGVLSELQEQLRNFKPALSNMTEKGMAGMPPKAYRWIEEMQQIAETMEGFGGFSGSGDDERSGTRKGGDLFRSASEVYKFIAEETELGKEKTEDRKVGKTAQEVAKVCTESLTPRYKLKKE